MLSFFKQRAVKPKKFYGDVFSVDAPETWHQNESEDNFLSITAPSDTASVTASSCEKEQKAGTLSEFAQMRFSAVHECFAPTGEAQQRESNGLRMIVGEYEGLWPGNKTPHSYLVACIQLTETIFVSLTITTRPPELKRNRKTYDDIINSVQRTLA